MGACVVRGRVPVWLCGGGVVLRDRVGLGVGWVCGGGMVSYGYGGSKACVRAVWLTASNEMRALVSNPTSVGPSSISWASSLASSQTASHSPFASSQSSLNASTSFCSLGGSDRPRAPSFAYASAATSLLGLKSPGSVTRAALTTSRSAAACLRGGSAERRHCSRVSLMMACSRRSASTQFVWCECTAAGKNTGMACASRAT